MPKPLLPPPPKLPKRVLTPPAMRSAAVRLELDAKTPVKTATAAEWSNLARVFDGLSSRKRDRLSAIGDLMLDLTDEQVERLLDLAIEMNGL